MAGGTRGRPSIFSTILRDDPQQQFSVVSTVEQQTQGRREVLDALLVVLVHHELAGLEPTDKSSFGIGELGVEVGDLGVANAAQQMVGQIGTVAGIQLLSTIQGGSVDGLPFTAAYLIGGTVAAAGVVAAGFISRRARVARVVVAEAA